MSFIPHYKPPELTLYLTCPVPDDILSTIQHDFDLGAHADYAPSLRLIISSRTDLYGLQAPEDVLRKLEDEGVYKDEEFTPFLIADERTVKEGKKGVVWFVEGWEQSEDFGSDGVVESARDKIKPDEKGRLPFAMKLRIYSHS